MIALFNVLSVWALPVMIAFIFLYALARGVPLYEAFVEGAKEGFWLSVRLIPFLVAIFVALGVFRESGAMGYLAGFLSPVLGHLGVPPEVLPLALIRPLSGSGSLGIAAELIRVWGPDSFVGRLASTMQGSTDTTFYILTFYFGSVGIKKTRHALAAGLAGDFAGFAAAVIICSAVFG